MFEELRKPRFLKDMPVIFIRSLPVIYYTLRTKKKQIPEKMLNLYKLNCQFLFSSVHHLANSEKVPQLMSIFDEQFLRDLQKLTITLETFNDFIIMLSQLCSESQSTIIKHMQAHKSWYIDNYTKTVPSLNLLVLCEKIDDMSSDKLIKNLKSFCFYHTELKNYDCLKLSKAIVFCDVVILIVGLNSKVHELAEHVEKYLKPQLAIAPIYDDCQQTMRIGAHLHKSGLTVLYKSFTPLRLFTSIDREYVLYNLT